MAVVDLGNATNQAGGVTSVTTPALLSAVSSGTLVVVFAASGINNPPGTLSVTDTKGNIYTQAANVGGFNNTSIYYSFITSSLTTSDTITYTDSASTGFGQFWISAVSASGYSAIDAISSAAVNNGFANTFSVTGGGTAAVTSEIYFGFSYTNSTFSGTPSGWTTGPPTTPASGAFLAGWQINSGTSALTWNGTTTGAQNTNSVIASFKPTVATSVAGAGGSAPQTSVPGGGPKRRPALAFPGGLVLTIPAAQGTYSLTGNAQTLFNEPATYRGQSAPELFSPRLGPERGFQPRLAFPVNLNIAAGVGSYTLNGIAATPGIGMPATVGSYALSGNAQTLTNEVATYRGQAAPELFAPRLGPEYRFKPALAFASTTQILSMPAAQGTYNLTGVAQTTTAGRSIAAAQGTYALTGVGQFFGIGLPITAGSYSLSGVAQAFAIGLSVHPVAGAYTLGGRAQTLTANIAGAQPAGTDAGGTITGGYFSRKKWHALIGELAKEAHERADQLKRKKERETVAVAIRASLKAAQDADVFGVGAEPMAAIAATLEAATRATKTAEVLAHVRAIHRHVAELKRQIDENDDEEAEAVELLWLL